VDDTDAARREGPDVVACERCPALTDCRSRIVNGDGPGDAPLLFVGEAPGETEDREGSPFVGRSGDVLDDALRDAGLARADVRVTNCVRCRPPDNRDPTAAELTSCRDHLDAEAAAVDPDLVVTLGKVPSEHLLDRSVAVTSEAGSVDEARLGGRARRVLVSLHPAATLYDASQREAFTAAVAEAAALAGVGDDGDDGGQSRLGDY
jgi:uracil-DNA glycosylase family 4